MIIFFKNEDKSPLEDPDRLLVIAYPFIVNCHLYQVPFIDMTPGVGACILFPGLYCPIIGINYAVIYY